MNKRPILILEFFLLSLILTACSMPETKIYSIGYSGQTASNIPQDKPKAYITINAPRHLSQPYIVYRTSLYELTISKYSKWDAPPSETVRDIVKDSLLASGGFGEVSGSLAAPAGAYHAKIDLKRFERSDSAEGSSAELLFDVSLISPEGKEVHNQRISKQVKLEDNAFRNLAKALNSAVLEAAKELTKRVSETLSSTRR
ncbi:MAG: hypothetical protein EPN22_09765 [Nitrospirae bacterium]|nr:MAG: hypothetical protein EPN22_09765 [Nitrospirota bacterium]